MPPAAGSSTETRHRRLPAARTRPGRWIRGLRRRLCGGSFGACVSCAGSGTKLWPVARSDPKGPRSPPSWADTGTCWSGTPSPAPAAACWCTPCAAVGTRLLHNPDPPGSGLQGERQIKGDREKKITRGGDLLCENLKLRSFFILVLFPFNFKL